MRSSPRRKVLFLVLLAGVVGVYLSADSRLVTGADSYAGVDRAVGNFNDAFLELTGSYFKELEPEKLSDAAINGMLEDLDPNTQFFDRRQLDQLRIKTRGNFGGLGISISLKNGDVPVVMSVFEGTPADTAGLLVGDRIVRVEGDSTRGRELQDVVDELRGEAGLPVVITIERPGQEQRPFDRHLIRAHIAISSVGLAETVQSDIGYISMSGALNGHFSESTGQELAEAIRRLQPERLKGLILDLRSNPGGLLTQAISVADKFLPVNRVVVSTRGRDATQNQEYRTKEPPLAGSIPLVVLVDGGSASASEIVAGAIQDSDRGLILGTPTFGKGSVQTIRQIGGEKALKLTTAVYYTPSGRSIHRAESPRNRGHRMFLTLHDTTRVPVYEAIAIVGQSERREEAVTELVERFGVSTEEAENLIDMDFGTLVGLAEVRGEDNIPKGSDPKEVFKTQGGRTVYGGGGITPDVSVEPERRPRAVIEMDRRYLFFDFAVAYAAGRAFPPTYRDFHLDTAIVDTFLTFIADTTRTGGYRYRAATEHRVDELERGLADRALTASEKAALAALKDLAASERDRELQEARPALQSEIEKAVAKRVWGEQAEQVISLRNDRQFEEAVRILRDGDVYAQKMHLAMAEKPKKKP